MAGLKISQVNMALAAVAAVAAALIVPNIGTGVADGVTAQNNTDATLAAPEQYGPIVATRGESWDTDNALSRELGAGWRLRGQSSPTPAVNLDLVIDSGTGAGWVSGNMVLGSGRLAIGATPATSGVDRREHGYTLRARNSANDANPDVLSFGSIATNTTVLGNNTNKTIVRGLPRVKATQTNAQALTAATPAALVFDGSDTYDSDTMHDPASNNTRLVFTTAGDYCVHWGVKLANNSTLRTVIRAGGTTELAHETSDSIAAYHAAHTGTYCDRFAAAAYVEIIATAGSSLNTTPANTYISAHMIGDGG